MGPFLKLIQTLKEYFLCNDYCAQLGNPWRQIVTAFCTVAFWLLSASHTCTVTTTSCRKSITWSTIFNQVLANLISGPINHGRSVGRIQTDDSQDVSNGPAVVVRKEDKRAMDATFGI